MTHQATVHGEDLLIDDSSDWQAVEAVGESLPQLDVITTFAYALAPGASAIDRKTLTLVVETVDSVDRGALVITTEDEEVFGILDLVCEQQTNGLERLLSSVDVITEEKVVGFWRETSVFEQPQEIVVLTVNITWDVSLNIST